MKVIVHLYSQSKPIEMDEVINTYTKDGLFCIMYEDRDVDKFPLQHIFRITEEEYSDDEKRNWDTYRSIFRCGN